MRAGLRLEGISKSFGATQVLDDVGLDVRPGEFVSLVGASGCGKSTLLRIIAGLEIQDAGRVTIGDRPVDALEPRARNVAMVFQNYALYPHMSVFDNIALPLRVDRLSLPERLPLIGRLSPRRASAEREVAAAVGSVAEQLRLAALLARKPGQLSGGQRQRVALARAIVRDPALFLMDEPLSNLDAQLRVDMRDEIADLHARLGTTFVYVTHDQVEAMTLSDRVAFMDKGRIGQFGTPSELYDRPATLTVARFIGSPPMNILAGFVGPQGRVMIGAEVLPATVAGLAGDPLSIGIRPEHVRLQAPDGAGWPGRVRRIEHHGPERLVHVDLVQSGPSASTTPLVARLSEGNVSIRPPRAGESVRIGLDPGRLHVFGADGRRMACEETRPEERRVPRFALEARA